MEGWTEKSGTLDEEERCVFCGVSVVREPGGRREWGVEEEEDDDEDDDEDDEEDDDE